jgi:ribonucleotide reductase alpha subunit
MVTTNAALHAAEAGAGRAGLKVGRYFTTQGAHPYDELEWELRDAVIKDWKSGAVAFEQRDVEFPVSWSMNATTIVAQKYFRGQLGTPQRERSVKHMIDRVADTITGWGRTDGYFIDEDSAGVFNHELKHLLVHQKAAFNSPVWFNVGVEATPQCSACQPWGALVATPSGYVPIGEIVDQSLVGLEVLDAAGTTTVQAVKHNGRKQVFRARLRNGMFVDATADHVVWATSERRRPGVWMRMDQLRPGMRMHLQPHRSARSASAPDEREVSEAALAGWLQADGFVGQYETGTNRSLTIEFQIANDDEYSWLKQHLDVVFPHVHRNERLVEGIPGFRRVRLHGECLREFVQAWDLTARRHDIRVPTRLWTAHDDVVAAYLRSVWQADGYVTLQGGSGRVGFAVISERWTEDLQVLLLRLGIYSRRYSKRETRDNRDLWVVDIAYLSERERFAERVGFIAFEKQDTLDATLAQPGKSCPDVREEDVVEIVPVGEMDVYDIQTASGEYLSNNIRIHNCFILSVEDTMSSILNWYVEEGTIFKGGSGSGVNLSRIRSSKEHLKGGGEASGPVSFMRGADASAGTIKSGGKTRRAAKMVILNVDHPDVEEFIWCKQREEVKARALREAGFDMDLDGLDSGSVQYQNANNSVRVTDEFMQAVQEGRDFHLVGVTDGDVKKTLPARDLMRQISRAAWECADPGMQYDTTINDWHTTPNAGRINGSNPCFPGDALVHTDKGLVRFDELVRRVQDGESFGVYTHDATNPDAPAERVELTTPEAFMITGRNPIVRLRFSNGMELRCTPGHKIFTTNRGYVPAEGLTAEDQVKVLNVATPAVTADRSLPLETSAEAYRRKGDHAKLFRLPEKWTGDLAHYLGYHTGDGAVSGSVISTVYGSDEEQRTLLPRHRALLAWLNGDEAPKPSLQANGTRQLRLSRRPLARFLTELGIASTRAPDKRVPRSIFGAPSDIVAEFLRGLFDADGCVVDQASNGTRYAGLGSASEGLLVDVQRLLSTFGIHSRIYHTKAAYQLRISGRSLAAFATAVGFTLPSKRDKLADVVERHERYGTDETVRLVSRADDGFELTYNLSEPRNHSYVVNGVVVRNCSEYMHLDNSACNLASLNLRKFESGGVFDVEAFKRAVEIVFTAQEIVIRNSSYPTEAIGRNARAYRQLGLGYANLGGLLMSQGLAYDSAEGRAWASAITALMTGHAYRTSAELARVQGPFDGYAQDRDGTLRVLRKHQAAADDIDASRAPRNILDAAKQSWADAVALGTEHGVRNAQATVLAPTGTIGLMMDCDTTGIEPDLGLVKMKKLVGGGSMKIVNRTVPAALAKLGYQPEQVEAIVAYIDDHSTIEGAPAFNTEHLPVFDCAMGDRSISAMGHVNMMAAVQPWISGAISKTVNLPESATVEDVEEMYVEGWKLGLKAIAIYRDNCKVAQPLAVEKKRAEPAATDEQAGMIRRRLPKQRPSQTFSFQVGDAEGYLTAGEYPGDGLGEIFVKLGKQGSTLSGVMDAFAIAVSIGLQYGVPLETYVKKFTNMRFEPAGMTDDPEVKFASSILDYIFRRLAIEYLPAEQRHELGIYTLEERNAQLDATYGAVAPSSPSLLDSDEPVVDVDGQTVLPIERPKPVDDTYGDAPMCFTCGVKMHRAGSCHVCPSCGTTSGCS